jgi:lipopolysaccharide biosynthesis glycosyltransferase
MTYNISFTANDKFLPYVSALILSICKNNTDIKIKFFIISGVDDFSLRSQKAVKKLCTHFNQDFEFVKIPEKILTHIKDNALKKTHYSYFTIVRLYFCEFLNVDRVLNLDADMICMGSIKELLDTPFDNKIVIMAKPHIKFKYNSRERERERERERVEIPLYNGGLFYFNLKKMKKLLPLIDELKANHTEEDIITILNYESKGKIIKEVSKDYNNMWQFKKANKNTKIVHFAIIFPPEKRNFIYYTYIYIKYLYFKVVKKNVTGELIRTFNKCRNIKYLRLYMKYQKEALKIMSVF